jgi:DNA repair protein RadC
MRVWEAKLSYNLLSLGEEPTLNEAEGVASYLKDAFDEDPTVEWFIAILLNRKNRPIARQIVTKGTATSSLVHPREVYKAAILSGATGIIVAHNHPSGDPAPSRADIQVTRQLREASKIIGIDLLDHVVIGTAEDDPMGRGYYSFNEAGLL